MKYLLTVALITTIFFGSSIGQKPDHLKLDVTFNPDSTMTVNAVYTLRERSSDSVYFLINPAFQFTKLEASGMIDHQMGMKAGRPFPFRLVRFDEDATSKNVAVTFQYTFDLKTMNHIKSNWIELNIDKFWFPNAHDLDNKFTSETTINGLYKDYSLVSYSLVNDVITPKAIMDPAGTIALKNNEPSAEVFIMLGANMQLWDAPMRNGKTHVFITKDATDSTLQLLGKRTDQLINFFNETFKTNPIDEYFLVMRNTLPGEINFLQSRGSILLGNAFAGSYPSLSHEISHYWWSKADFINEPWMNESFANLSMLYALEKFDEKQFNKQLTQLENGGEKGSSIRGTTTFDPNGMATYYYKGAWLLWQLDQEIGRDNMFSVLQERINQNVDSTDGFLSLLEENKGKDTRDSFASKLE